MTFTSKGFQVMIGTYYDPSSANNDYFQGEHLNNIIQSLKGNKVISGFEVIEQGIPSLTVDIDAGSAYINGTERSLSADVQDMTSSLPLTLLFSRYSIIYLDSVGAMQVLDGVEKLTGTQIIPEIIEDTVPLAVVLLTNGDTTVNTVDIGDLRLYVKQNEWIDGKLVVNETIDSRIITGTAPFIIASTTLNTNLNADMVDGHHLDQDTLVASSPTFAGLNLTGNISILANSITGTSVDLSNADLQELDNIAGLSKVDGTFIVGDGATFVAEIPSVARVSLGLAIGSDVQAFDSDLAAIAGFGHVDGNIMVSDGVAWVLESGATARTSLGVAIGSDVQAYNAFLTTIAGLAKDDGNFVVTNGSTFAVESGATARTSLGLGSMALQNSISVSITGGSLDGVSLYNVPFLRMNADFDLHTNNLDFNDGVAKTLTPIMLNYLLDIYNTGVTSTEFDYLDGVTSAIQTQFSNQQSELDAFGYNSKYLDITEDRLLYSTGTIGFGSIYRSGTSVTLGNGTTYNTARFMWVLEVPKNVTKITEWKVLSRGGHNRKYKLEVISYPLTSGSDYTPTWDTDLLTSIVGDAPISLTSVTTTDITLPAGDKVVIIFEVESLSPYSYTNNGYIIGIDLIFA